MKKQHGSTLLIILIVLVTLTGAVLGALSFTSTVSRNVQRSNQHRRAIEIADGSLDYAFAHWREKGRPLPNVHLKTSDLADIPVPPASYFPAVTGFTATTAANRSFTLSNFRVKAVGPTWQAIPDDQTPQAAYGMDLGSNSHYYLASADVTLPGISGKPIEVNVRRVFEKQILSPWNYAIFYTDRLEIHPGPEFHVTGWVHTNERLYTAHSTLFFESKVTYGEDWYNKQYAPGDDGHGGEFASANWKPNLPPALEQAHQPFGLDSTRIFNSSDTNPNNDSYRELVERPTTGFTDPIAEARYYNQADVRLIVANDGSGNPFLTILNNAGVTCTSTSTGYNKDLYDVFKDAVILNQKLQDSRELKEVRLVSIDMAKVNAAIRPAADSATSFTHRGKLYGDGFKGIIYATDTSATSTNRRGIRLRNGGTMPPGGLTVATDNPLYIQGDYNTGTNGALQPNSNLPAGDPTQNTVAGYTKQSCAVLADAVMILSNAWTDAASYSDVGSRVATSTTVNTAIVAGIVPTVPGGTPNYSGGAENFPRFLEKWGSARSLTYHGSMVQLYNSKQHIAPWGSDNVYDPPSRKWYFDTKFYTDPPPGTLSLVSYGKGRWYLE